MLKAYRNWRPMGADIAGLSLPDHQDWLVVPVILTRDASILEQSNWETVATDLATHSSDDWLKAGFNHWACGWFDILLVRPGSTAHECAEAWDARLSDYPVASESDYSERQCNAVAEFWGHASLKEKVRACQEADCSVFAARRNCVPGKVFDQLLESGEFQ